jgi:hypothetical protein
MVKSFVNASPEIAIFRSKFKKNENRDLAHLLLSLHFIAQKGEF